MAADAEAGDAQGAAGTARYRWEGSLAQELWHNYRDSELGRALSEMWNKTCADIEDGPDLANTVGTIFCVQWEAIQAAGADRAAVERWIVETRKRLDYYRTLSALAGELEE